jgi:hypothetical protein
MDKDIYIYKYEESVCFWDILKRVISAASEGNDQPPELSIVFVFFYGSKEREREKRATRLLKDTRKDKMICVYSFFRFIILHTFITLHSETIETKTTQITKKKISQTEERFLKKICATRQAHDTASKKTSKNSPVCINVVLFHKQQVSNGLYNS